MKVVIETQLNIVGNRGSSQGAFFVNNRDFKEDPNLAVAVVAYD
ncbi:hypothetical protein [Cytobacillus pseudoceanisediminis]|nr:hypothetical protein [Cytobacillus pseudoceanisediminis]